MGEVEKFWTEHNSFEHAMGGVSAAREAESPDAERVHHPAHYGGKGDYYEAIKVIEAWGLGFHLGSAVKYIARAGKKPGVSKLEDLEKAAWYLTRMVNRECAEIEKGLVVGEGGVMGDPKDIEALAAAEHESWMGWAVYMLDRVEQELADSSIPDALHAFQCLPGVKRWRRQAVTPYADLPEKEKESDRVEARKKIEVYQ